MSAAEHARLQQEVAALRSENVHLSRQLQQAQCDSGMQIMQETVPQRQQAQQTEQMQLLQQVVQMLQGVDVSVRSLQSTNCMHNLALAQGLTSQEHSIMLQMCLIQQGIGSGVLAVQNSCACSSWHAPECSACIRRLCYSHCCNS